MNGSRLGRRMTGWVVLALLAVVGWGRPGLAADKADKADGPINVVLIYCDDLGYGDLGCFGHESFKTPRIDRLAAEGARLTDFYACCPYCAPSRGGLQTGRYPFHNGLGSNPCPGGKSDNVGLPTSEKTLGEMFQAGGYKTICVGKWHLGHKPEFYPTRNGYDEYLGILYSNDMHPVELWEGEKVIEYPVYQASLTKRYTERVISFIERNRDKPFFVYLPHAMPHKPLAASESFYRKSGAGLYGDVMAELDWSVGQIIDKLRDLKLDKRTLVLFTSDNGPWYGGSTAGLRGMKGLSTEGGLRVPLIAWWPGHIPAGHVSEEPAIIMDLFTTCLNVCGLDVPHDRIIDGKNIMPLLTGDAKSPHEALFGVKGGEIHSVRSGPWKLHLRPVKERGEVARGDAWVDPRRPDGVTLIAPYEQAKPTQYPGLPIDHPIKSLALFNLDKDPGEQHDVAADHPEVVSRLKAMADLATK